MVESKHFHRHFLSKELPHNSPAASLLATCGGSLEGMLYHLTVHYLVNKFRL